MGITKMDIVMSLLGGDDPGSASSVSIEGITRLQKLLFLVENESGVKVTEGPDFDFTAYKFGPVSKALYDDLEKLQNLGYLKAEGGAEPTPVELDEYGLSFEGLMGDEQSASDAYEEHSYRLTDKGVEWVRSRADQLSADAKGKIRKIRGKYGNLSLSDLLYYVYTKYPKMTTESEIRDRVLSR